jgi:hypothetical protein
MKRSILEAVMNEHIRLAGCPQLIVTREWACAWLVKMGYPPHGGFGSADYMAFGRPEIKEELTDMDDPNVKKFLTAVEEEVRRA